MSSSNGSSFQKNALSLYVYHFRCITHREPSTIFIKKPVFNKNMINWYWLLSRKWNGIQDYADLFKDGPEWQTNHARTLAERSDLGTGSIFCVSEDTSMLQSNIQCAVNNDNQSKTHLSTNLQNSTHLAILNFVWDLSITVHGLVALVFNGMDRTKSRYIIDINPMHHKIVVRK